MTVNINKGKRKNSNEWGGGGGGERLKYDSNIGEYKFMLK